MARSRRGASVRKFWATYRRDREGMIGLGLIVAIGLVAIFAPLLANRDDLSVVRATGPIAHPPTLHYLLGTDDSGRSVLSMIIFGSRTSLLVGLSATIISMIIGTTVGVAAGHFGGLTGGSLNRLTDWFLVIPYLPLAIALRVALANKLPALAVIIIVIGVTSWSGTARLVRAQTLSIEGRPYLERARALGAGHWHQMTRHVLPNVMPLVLANTTLTVSISILAETTLSFLGLGDPTNVSWGTILNDSYDRGAVANGLWWWVIFPGVAVVIVVRAFNMCGRAMERVLDPRLQERG